MPRIYKQNRAWAPPLVEILRYREIVDSFESIVDTYGCHRRTVYSAVDRAARWRRLPPIMIPLLFPGDIGAQQRMADLVSGAHRSGMPVPYWEHVAAAKALVA